MHLTIRQKVLLLPGLAVLGACAIGLATYAANRASQADLVRIQRGEYPALERGRKLEIALTSLQRRLQDAVAAADTSALANADSLAAELRDLVSSGAGNAVIAPEELRQDRDLFDAYYALARRTSAAMIAGETGDAATRSVAEMTQGYRTLSERLAAATREREARIERAFSDAHARQQTAFAITGLCLVLVLLGLFGTSLFVARALIGALRRISAAAREIATGDLDVNLGRVDDDEVGQVVASFGAVVEYLRDIARAADRLAAGDVGVDVAPRSEHDVLAVNLGRAMATLRQLLAETGALIDEARAGNLRARGEPERFQGAYADLVRGTNAMLAAVIEPLADASAVLARVAQRDLTARVGAEYAGDLKSFRDSLNQAVDNLDQALGRVAAGAEQLSSASSQIRVSSHALAEGASDQAGSLEEIASSLQEMASVIAQSATNAQEVRELAARAREATDGGTATMGRLSTAIGQIAASSAETAKIVKTIDEIAFQTNLLALNAAVEAARAGDAGAGFAVVADEVRNLAGRSAEAARRTAELIEDSRRSVADGVARDAEVRSSLAAISSQVSRVAEVIAEVAAATEQQNQGVSQVSVAVEDINHVTQRSAAGSEESASMAEHLSRASDDLSRMVDGFRLTAVKTTPQIEYAEGREAPVRAPARRPRAQKPEAGRRPTGKAR